MTIAQMCIEEAVEGRIASEREAACLRYAGGRWRIR